LIGIQKSLGAKNYFILFQFLFESILLCIIGSLAGMALVACLTLIHIDGFDISLTPTNISIGIIISSCIGILAGVIPAYKAAKMDPVEAIRSK
jgi:putative ABC transport system permease protein